MLPAAVPAPVPDRTITFAPIITLHPEFQDAPEEVAELNEATQVLRAFGQETAANGLGALAVFLIHGYGSNGIDLRESLFNWVGRVQLDLRYRIKVFMCNWDGVSSVDSKNWLSKTWMQRMIPTTLHNSVSNAERVGDKIVQMVNAANFSGRLGLIGHSMGTHAVNRVVRDIPGRVAFAMHLNPHVYIDNVTTAGVNPPVANPAGVPGSRVFVAVNQGDKVLRASRSVVGKHSWGDLSCDTWANPFNKSDQIFVTNNACFLVVGEQTAALYDTPYMHGIYMHPFIRLVVIRFLRGGSLPVGVIHRGGFTVARQQLANGLFIKITLDIFSKYERLVVDNYIQSLQKYYQHGCRVPLHRVNHTENAANNRSQVFNVADPDLEALNGMDWDALNVVLPALGVP